VKLKAVLCEIEGSLCEIEGSFVLKLKFITLCCIMREFHRKILFLDFAAKKLNLLAASFIS
jgi:hypothetical protein